MLEKFGYGILFYILLYLSANQGVDYVNEKTENEGLTDAFNSFHHSKPFDNCGVGQIGQYFSDGEYSNYLFYEVSKRFNNLLPEQNPTRYSEKQLEIFRLIQSIHKDGLGYRRIAKVLNERGLTTEEGYIWKSPDVYSVIKRYSERLERLKFRRKKYPLVRGKMWMEFTK